MKQKIEIDFFYFSALTKACIPPCPFGLYEFWYKVIDEYYEILEEQERAKLYDFITGVSYFQITNLDCALFEARYNLDNQYMVSATLGTMTETNPCFKWKDGYYVKSNRSVVPECITKVEKIEPFNFSGYVV